MQVSLHKLFAQVVLPHFSEHVFWSKCVRARSLHAQPYAASTIFLAELRKRTSRTTFVLKSCDLLAGAMKVYFA